MASLTTTESVRHSNEREDKPYPTLRVKESSTHSANAQTKGYTTGNSKEKRESATELAFYQGIIFGTLFLGYATYTFARKIFAYAAPTLMGQQLLSQSDMGIVNSSQYFAYAISKFLGGILSDKVSAKLLFPAGLLVSGMTVICVAFSTDPRLWAFLWFLNGLGQGCGWPAVSKLLKKWFDSKQFGTCWSLLTASSNVSGTVGPLIAAFCFASFGWRVSFIMSGCFSLLISLLSFALIREAPPKYLSLTLGPKPSPPSPPSSRDSNAVPNKGDDSYLSLFRSPLLWVVSVCYLVVFGTKTALSDWAQVFLIQDLGRTNLQASGFCSAMETGGFFGGILAGVATDRLNAKFRTQGNIRMLASCGFLLCCSASLHLLAFHFTPQTPQLVLSATGLLVGASLFGPISIFGIVASESFAPAISGASHAVVALAANVGAILAGYPLSKAAEAFGWNNLFLFMEIWMLGAIFIILSSRRFHKTQHLKSS